MTSLLDKNVETEYIHGGKEDRVLLHSVDMIIGQYFSRNNLIKFKKVNQHGPHFGVYIPDNFNIDSYL